MMGSEKGGGRGEMRVNLEGGGEKNNNNKSVDSAGLTRLGGKQRFRLCPDCIQFHEVFFFSPSLVFRWAKGGQRGLSRAWMAASLFLAPTEVSQCKPRVAEGAISRLPLYKMTHPDTQTQRRGQKLLWHHDLALWSPSTCRMTILSALKEREKNWERERRRKLC